MAVSFILSKPGANQYSQAYQNIIEESINNPDSNYFIITPEQNNFSTQKKFLKIHPRHAITNVDITTFNRLNYRIIEDNNLEMPTVLRDESKNFIIKKIIIENANHLDFIRNKHDNNMGYVLAIKSFLSEMDEYNINNQDIEKIIKDKNTNKRLKSKLKDILFIREKYADIIKQDYITKENILDFSVNYIHKSYFLKNSVFLFDGFTGFTESQHKMIEEIMKVADKVIINFVCKDRINEQECSYISNIDKLITENIIRIKETARNYDIEVLDDVYIEDTLGQEGLGLLRFQLFNDEIISSEIDNESLKLIVCDDNECEVKALTQEVIEALHQGYKYKDISILVGDSTYNKYIEYYFDREGFNYFKDERYNVLLNPLIDYLLSILDVISNNYSQNSFLRYIKNIYSPLNNSDVYDFENYIYINNITGYKRFSNPFTNKLSKMTDEDLERLNELRANAVNEIEKLRIVFKDKNSSIKTITDAILSYIYSDRIIKAQEEIKEHYIENNDLYMVSVIEEINDYLSVLFNNFISFLGTEHIKFKEYVDMLVAGIKEAKIGVIPVGNDEILIGDLTRSRFEDTKILFVLGCNDGVLANNLKTDNLFSQIERKFLKEHSDIKLSPSLVENNNIANYYLYRTLNIPSDKLILLRSKKGSENNLLTEHEIITQIKTIYNNLNDTYFSTKPINKRFAIEYLIDNFNASNINFQDKSFDSILYYLKNVEKINNIFDVMECGFNNTLVTEELSKKTTQSIFENTHQISISTIQNYSRCPMKYYLEKIVRLMPIKPLEYGHLDIGSVNHEILEYIFKNAKDNNISLRDISDVDLMNEVKKGIKLAFDEKREVLRNFSNMNNFIAQKNIENLTRYIFDMQKELRSGQFEPYLIEYEFGKKDNKILINADKQIYLTGKIDRVDISPNKMFRIIDYKNTSSSTSNFKAENIESGTDIQLLVYGHVMSKIFSDMNLSALTYSRVNVDDLDKNDKTGLRDITDEEIITNLRIRKENKDSLYLNAVNSFIAIGGDEYVDNIDRYTMIKFNKGKERVLSKNSLNYLLDKDKMDSICKDAINKVKETTDNMLSGKIKAKPHKYSNNRTTCDYCDYRDICRVNNEAYEDD